ncbi:MAG: hypothetical protein JWR38_4340 [Mucilaginibacter sp.]|nr:hypothetical protein [Mucilaginibacter sp.]
MAQLKSIKKWFWIHRWTSLICTLFLLMLCLTGLPLIFGEEIDEWLSNDPPYAAMPKNTPTASLDNFIGQARHRYPKDVITYVFIDDDEPQVVVNMLPSFTSDDKLTHSMQFDSRTAKLLKDEPPLSSRPPKFTAVMLSLHRDMFMDLPGELFLGFMGLLFVVSIISGVVLYGPFMKKLNFGTMRYDRSRRVKWLDLHNLLGIVTMAWLFVVGATGVMNELSTPLFGLWQMTDVKTMLQQYKGKPTPKTEELSLAQAAFETAKQAVPGTTITSLVFPGNIYGSPFHYLFWAKGNTALTSRLYNPVLVDARTGKLAAVVKMPWYLRSIEVSRPLHFGDYGGIPLKIIWVLFDVAAIVVLISGIYLWFAKRKFYEDYFLRQEQNEVNTPITID